MISTPREAKAVKQETQNTGQGKRGKTESVPKCPNATYKIEVHVVLSLTNLRSIVVFQRRGGGEGEWNTNSASRRVSEYDGHITWYHMQTLQQIYTNCPLTIANTLHEVAQKQSGVTIDYPPARTAGPTNNVATQIKHTHTLKSTVAHRRISGSKSRPSE